MGEKSLSRNKSKLIIERLAILIFLLVTLLIYFPGELLENSNIVNRVTVIDSVDESERADGTSDLNSGNETDSAVVTSDVESVNESVSDVNNFSEADSANEKIVKSNEVSVIEKIDNEEPVVTPDLASIVDDLNQTVSIHGGVTMPDIVKGEIK